eukprot:1362096-Prymnesium_polylepis.3
MESAAGLGPGQAGVGWCCNGRAGGGTTPSVGGSARVRGSMKEWAGTSLPHTRGVTFRSNHEY